MRYLSSPHVITPTTRVSAAPRQGREGRIYLKQNKPCANPKRDNLSDLFDKVACTGSENSAQSQKLSPQSEGGFRDGILGLNGTSTSDLGRWTRFKSRIQRWDCGC